MKSIKLDITKPQVIGLGMHTIYQRFEINIDFDDDSISYRKCLAELNEVQEMIDEIIATYVREKKDES